ncbi:MAG: alkaline phosphatase family protein [Myxococcales bacterium]|nr:alkaline phosphatase family protein [Myxococcales bacterium]
MRWNVTGLFLGLLLVCLALVSGNAIRVMQRQNRVADVTKAAEGRHWSETLALSDGWVGGDVEGQMVARARCDALVALERFEECLELVLQLVGTGNDPTWIPSRTLLKHAIRFGTEQRQEEAAARVARFGRGVYPDDLSFVERVFETRIALEGETAVLTEYEAGLGPDAASLRNRVLLAAYYNRANHYEAALRVLGNLWPAPQDPIFLFWVQNRERAQAQLGRLEDLRATYAKWREIQGDSVAIDAFYSLSLSTSGLSDPERSWIDLLQDVLAREDELQDAYIHGEVYTRLIMHLMVERRYEEALTFFDRGASKIRIRSITRGQLERAIAMPESDAGEWRKRRDRLGTIQFSVSDPVPSDRLWVSNHVAGEPDSEFQEVALDASGRAEFRRGVSPWPERWVLKDRDGHPRASGRFWTRLDQPVRITAERGPARPEAHFEPRSRAPADGRTRVLGLVLDCSDWRITQYLRARGELPFTDFLIRNGTSAVLTSDPPFTAMAMESLIYPTRGEQLSFLGLVHRMGLEIGGLASVATNPFDFLSAALPMRPNLFETIGAGDRVAVNMLFSHGRVEAGHHAEAVGPFGKRLKIATGPVFRPLRRDERERMPVTRSNPEVRVHVEAIAGEFDSGSELFAAGEVDLLLLRIEALDILTHMLVHDLLENGQDDGEAALHSIYRYIDDRMAELYHRMDEDDIIVVMSDHGIRTGSQHETDAIFVVLGPGISKTRIAGRPDLKGIPAMFARLLGVDVPEWPSAGLQHVGLTPAVAAR